MNFPITKSTILIIEDVAGDIDILDHILKNDYLLQVAKTGESGIKMAIEHQPDLILLDIVLPDMTGFATLEKLKELSETKDIPVLIITGVNSVQYEEKGLNLGAVDYITKPLHNTVVMARIRTHLRILHYIRTLERLGWTDPLTGLPNRAHFEKQVESAWSRSRREQKPLGLLMIDLDRFREYNVSYGNQSGDIVLQKAAEVINAAIKRPGDSAFRFEGDRFAVLLPNMEKEETHVVAEAIRTGIETMEACFQESRLSPITVSIGVTSRVPGQEEIAGNLIAEAETGLRQAQESGSNCVCTV